MAKSNSVKLYGQLVATSGGGLSLRVSADIVRGIFNALDEKGLSLPTQDGRLLANIVVMLPDELESIGGKAKITELGKRFAYQLGSMRSLSISNNTDIERIWFVSIRSYDLQQLRQSYGLPSFPRWRRGESSFHMPVAIRKPQVLKQNRIDKTAAMKIVIQRTIIRKSFKLKDLVIAAEKVLSKSQDYKCCDKCKGD